MMIEILKEIFKSNEYEQVAFDLCLIDAEYAIYTPKRKENKEEYFVLLELKHQSQKEIKITLEKLSEYLFEKIMKFGAIERYFGKNSTLIICHKQTKIDRMTTLALEEDLYNFKKNVILYSEEEINDLINHLASQGIVNLTNKTLLSIINEENGSSFVNFKNKKEKKGNYYSIIIKIFLKVPFLTYQTEKKKLDAIESNIDKELNIFQRKISDDILNFDSEWSDEKVHEFAAKNWSQ